jgi:DNA repair protein SbcC/Rad50
MIFKRFVTQKAQRNGLPQDQDGLLRVIRSDADNALRREACRRLCRLPELRGIAEEDMDAGVRELAAARYRKLLCGGEPDAPALAERLREIAQVQDPRVIEQVAADAADGEMRQAAIARLASAPVLIACALNDPLAANRSAAAERLEDRPSLEQLARTIGKRDKNVYRIARQKLKEIAEREALPARVRAQCDELCERLERLGRFESWSQDRALLDHLDRQWAEIEADADAEARSRFTALRERFLAAFDAYRREHAAQIAAEEARQALRRTREGLLEELAAVTELPDEEEIGPRSDELAARWQALEALPEREQAALDKHWQRLWATAAERREALGEDRRRAARLGKLIGAAEKALQQGKPLEHKRVRSLVDDGRRLAGEGVEPPLAERFAGLAEQLEERLRKQQHTAEKRLAEITEKLDELDRAVEAGELKHAEPLYQSLLSAQELIQASSLPRQQWEEAARRLHELAPRVRDLQKWRKWGADQHREQLCTVMEELLTADMPLEALSLRLHDLQMEWKGLDKGGSPVNHPLWERFHALSEQVYGRCKPFLEAQAVERETNRRHREALCAELEHFLDAVDWERMDWKKAVRAEREMRQAWGEAGPTEGRHRKGLEKRFRTAMKRLDERLAAERARNQGHKRDLIARVAALAEAADLDDAIEETKRLQREWHTTVPARQKEENRLWQEFRGACDTVFARRREQYEARAAEQGEHLRLRESLCEEAEALATAELDQDDFDAALLDLALRWEEAETLPVPRQGGGGLTRRWREAQGRLRRRRQEVREQVLRGALDLLARQAALCEGLERAEPPLPDAAEAGWQALPVQADKGLQSAIEARFQRALTAAREGPAGLARLREALAGNAARRAEICLQLEILARVDSPPELTKERLAFQVARLKDHMRDGERDPLEGAQRLLEAWYLCATVPHPESASLNERFERARAALEKTDRESEAA